MPSRDARIYAGLALKSLSTMLQYSSLPDLLSEKPQTGKPLDAISHRRQKPPVLAALHRPAAPLRRHWHG
jgi:hypothetical protein